MFLYTYYQQLSKECLSYYRDLTICIIDLLMAGAMMGEGTSYPNLTHTVELTTEEYGVGCRKGSDLAEYINEQFKSLYADGTMTEIAETYGVQDALIEQ